MPIGFVGRKGSLSAVASAALIAAGLQFALPAPAQAYDHGWHGGGGCCWGGWGWGVGAGLATGLALDAALAWPPYYAPYPPPYAYYPAPAVTVVQPNPVVVAAPPVAAQPAAAAPAAGQYWYYCKKPAGYYPYVQNCSIPWQPVSPVPPGAPR